LWAIFFGRAVWFGRFFGFVLLNVVGIWQKYCIFAECGIVIMSNDGTMSALQSQQICDLEKIVRDLGVCK
jgi:hypothetical protein